MSPLLRHLTLTHRWLLVIASAIIPLTLAFVVSAYYLKQKFDSPRKVAELVNFSNKLSYDMEELERVTRLYARIGDQTHLDIYRVKRQDFDKNLTELKTGIDTANLSSLQEQLHKLDQLLDTSDPRNLSDQAIKALFTNDHSSPFGQAKNSVNQLIHDIYHRIDQSYDRVVAYVVMIFVVTLPITLLMVFLASLAITRPIQRLSKAIHCLGSGDWEKPVRIYGPPELEALGVHLEWTRQCLIATEQQKHILLTHVTHELKTPLAAIIEANAQLKDQIAGPINAKQLRLVDMLSTHSENLRVLIQQLLNYNAVRNSRAITSSKVDMSGLCANIRQKLMDARPNSQCRWKIWGTPTFLATDRQGIEMILSNLMSNARDFSPEQGYVEVNWSQTDTHWTLRVSDNGPGISQEEQKRIFEPFFQGTATRRGALKGTGMGLAIVRECVTQMHGHIKVASNHPGTCFTLTFPTVKLIEP